MPKRCVAQFCDGTVKLGVSMHFFPKDPVLRRKWEQFVQVKRQNFYHASPYSVLCSKHFEADDYESSMMQMFGFKAKNNTRLKKDAVPTIHAPSPKPVLVDPETGLCSRPAGQPPTSSPSLVRNRYTSKVLAEASSELPGPRQPSVRGRKLPQKHVYEEVLTDQLFWDQEEPEPPQTEVRLEEPEPSPMEKNKEEPEVLQFKVELEEPKPPQIKEEPEFLQIKVEPEPHHIKEEPEDHIISQEQPVLYQGFSTLMVLQSESHLPEPFGGSADNMVQFEDEIGGQPGRLGTNWKPRTELPEEHVSQEELHPLCNQNKPKPYQVMKRDQEEPEPLQMKEDQEEICISQAQGQLVVNQENATVELDFGQKGNLLSQERSWAGETPYSCRKCGKHFSQRKNLKTHRRTYCSECGKCFNHRGNFLQHMRTHTGEKPYSCTECGKRFTVSGGLSRHRRVHTGEKVYSCTECGKRFSQRGVWVRHLQTHGKEKPSCQGKFSVKRFVCWFT